MNILCLGLALASASEQWYVGEWKADIGEGLTVATRFGSNGKGIFGVYKESEIVQKVNIEWRREGNDIVFSRNGVDVKFPLNEAQQAVYLSGGQKMEKMVYRPIAKGGCEEACFAVNASEKDLLSVYGVAQVPAQFQYAQPFSENQGYSASSQCFKPYGLMGMTDPIIGERCRTKGDEACIQACKASQK